MLKWLKKKKHSPMLKRGTELSVVVPAVLEDDRDLYRAVGGMPMIARTLLALDQISEVREVVVVIREAELKRIADLCRAFGIQRVRKVVCARDPGIEALMVGVYECEAAEYIALHDPLRPFVTEAVFLDALGAAVRTGAGAPAVAVKDTIKIVRDGVVEETPDRSTLRILQTPQMIESSLLKAALCRAKEAGADAADLPTALELLGLPLQLAEGSDENMRVAADTDIPVAETILTKRMYA